MSIRRLVSLTAAQLCCACLASAAAFASSGMTPAGLASSADSPLGGNRSPLLAVWSDLWRTPDQQGQALLDAGEPAQAAARFHDPRRRAYADAQAGRYQDAAKLLEPFTDAQSEYNRGNALAKTGQLQAALAAYDAALKQAPADKDIRHNRDLVERALRQQHQSQQSSGGNGKQGRQSAGSAQQKQQPGQSASGQQGGGASQQASGNGQQSGASGSQSSASQSAASQSAASQSAASQSAASQSGRSQSAGDGQLGSNGANHQNGADSGAPQSTTGSDSGAQNEKAGQAQRDAADAAALARQQQQRGQLGRAGEAAGSSRSGAAQSLESAQAETGARKPSGAQSLIAGGTQAPKQKPETERQLALDQWLRQIPDSPAGLLQRKFLIEHMMRQQDSADQRGDGQ